MKRYLIPALLAVGVLLFAAPNAFAAGRRFVFDPPGISDPVCSNNQPCNVLSLNDEYTNTWVKCSTGGIPSGLSGFTYCLWFNNVSGHAANGFTFSMAVPTGEGGQSVDCSASPPSIATSNCPSTLPADGDLFSLKFHANPALPDGKDFYLASDFPNMPGPAGVVESVPEPGSLGMLGLGLAIIALGFRWNQRRHERRITLQPYT